MRNPPGRQPAAGDRAIAPGLDDLGGEVTVLSAVSHALIAWHDWEQGSSDLLAGLADALGFGAAALWLPTDGTLERCALWCETGSDRRALEAMLDARPPHPTGANEAVVRELRGGSHRGDTHKHLPRWSVVIPATAGAHLLGVVAVFASEQPACSARMMRVLSTAGQLIGAFLARREGEAQPVALTPRELEILSLSARGFASEEIAQLLTISRSTVKSHFEHSYRKLGVQHRTAAVARALRAGLIE